MSVAMQSVCWDIQHEKRAYNMFRVNRQRHAGTCSSLCIVHVVAVTFLSIKPYV